MTDEWSNWSGSLRFTPARIEEPESEEHLASAVRKAHEEGRKVRVVGSGHSSSPLVQTEDTLISLAHLTGLYECDPGSRVALIGGGTTLKEAGAALLEKGLAFANLGDVDFQTVAGVIGTGTHGTGRELKALPDHLIGVRLVTGAGEIKEFTAEEDPEFLRAARVSLGVLGIFTAVRLRLEPAFRLHRREWCARIEVCMDHLNELIEENRNVDMYWYPRSDLAKIRIANIPGEKDHALPFARCVKEETGWISEILPKQRELRFDEMEYWLPEEAGPTCFEEVRRRVKAKHRQYVGWRVLYRTIAADDSYLSGAYERNSVTISLHQNASLPFQGYFDDIEPIFRAYGGRPHWGKKHSLGAADLRPHYPMWDRFLEFRRELDPDGTFLSPYLCHLLGID